MGYDQILIETIANADTIGAAIADMFNSKYYEDGAIWNEHKRIFGFGRAIGMLFVTFLIGMILEVFHFKNITSFDPSNNNIWLVLIVSLVVGILVGFTAKLGKAKRWDIIELSTSRKNRTLVLIRRYDSDGNRTLDEATIHDVINVVEESDKNAIITGL